MAFCGFGCVSKKVSGCWFLALEVTGATTTTTTTTRSSSSSKDFRRGVPAPGDLVIATRRRRQQSPQQQQQQQQQQQKQQQQQAIKIAFSSKLSEGTFRPPGILLLRLILRHFRHEIRWCFAVSAVFRKRCLADGFLL